MTVECPFCGSDHVIKADALQSFIQPDSLIPFNIDKKEAETELEAVAADEGISSLAENPGDAEVEAEPVNAKVSDKDEELFRERMQLSDHKIAKPSERLESDDGYLAKSIFDSVRIMENKVPDAQEYIDTRIASEPGGRKSEAHDSLADSHGRQNCSDASDFFDPRRVAWSRAV